MAGEIHITKDFRPAREKAVLLELLNIMRALKDENIDAIVCGGWVPFLKELARDSQSSHSMSLISTFFCAPKRVSAKRWIVSKFYLQNHSPMDPTRMPHSATRKQSVATLCSSTS